MGCLNRTARRRERNCESMNGNKDEIREYIKSHEDALKQRKQHVKNRPTFWEQTKIPQTTHLEKPALEPAPIPSTPVVPEDLALLRELIEGIAEGLSTKFLSELVISNKLVIAVLKKITALHITLKKHVEVISDTRTRSRET